MEPRVNTTRERVEALKQFRDAGIPTVVWLSPLLPWLNDTEENLLGILDSCREAGVKGILNFGMGLTLRDGDREYYYAALDRHFPGLKQRYMQAYGNAYELPSPNARELWQLFHEKCEAYGIWHDNKQIFSYMTTFEERDTQLSFF